MSFLIHFYLVHTNCLVSYHVTIFRKGVKEVKTNDFENFYDVAANFFLIFMLMSRKSINF